MLIFTVSSSKKYLYIRLKIKPGFIITEQLKQGVDKTHFVNLAPQTDMTTKHINKTTEGKIFHVIDLQGAKIII